MKGFLTISSVIFLVSFSAKSFADDSLKKLQLFWLNAYENQLIKTQSTLEMELLAKAEPDECFSSIGGIYNPDPSCTEGIPKVNQAYIWGLAKSGENLWLGTVANTHCLVIGNYFGLEELPAHETISWVCEFGQSDYGQTQFPQPLPAGAGDFRSPRIFMYNTHSKTLTEKTQDVLPAFPDALQLKSTIGLRSAGTLENVVIMGGVSLLGSLNLFAFNATTGEYLGSANLAEYNNCRKWLVADNVLYTAVANVAGGGSVLRWVGDESSPFEFEVVGNIDSDGAELVLHDGKLFVSTWPNLREENMAMSGLWMSPEVPAEGLTSADADQWRKVWRADDYEPDPVTAMTYGGGALASFEGYLYWGTMHVPFLSTIAHMKVYEPDNTLALLGAISGTQRAISIFRGNNFDTDEQEIELLYGMRRLPVYITDPEDSLANGRWEIQPNKMGVNPKWGLAGFGNYFNNYTWTMEVFQDKLYVGTMDWSYLLKEGMKPLMEYLFEMQGIPYFGIEVPFPTGFFGADLYYFPSAESPAFPESIDGVGNYTNYGIRTMISDDALYLGTANPMNLLTDPNDDLPEGGWELLRLSQFPSHVKDNSENKLIVEKKYALLQNHPNPFNPSTTIEYVMSKPGHIRLAIYDLLGRHIRTLTDSFQQTGNFRIRWNGKDEHDTPVAAGVYLCRLEAKDFVKVIKLALIK